MSLIEALFWIALLGSGYSYFIYPLILLLFQRNDYLATHKGIETTGKPTISVIITAYNEGAQIANKINNTLEADYDAQLLEILIASDGSTDTTNDIVMSYRQRGVTLVEVPDRKGKENAQLHAIRQAKGEILVFSDVSTQIESTSLNRIAQVFANPAIGAVSSEDRFLTSEGEIAGEGAYVKYEMWLRKLESSANSLVGLSGSFFSCRSTICKNWNISIPSDFNTAINCVQQGYVAITDPKLLGYYPNIKDETKEYQRKVRTVLRGMAAFAHHKSLLSPFKHGFFTFQLLSHKLMRWLVPWFMLLTLSLNLTLLDQHLIYSVMLTAQLTFYLVAIMGHISVELRRNKLIKVIYFFIQVNLAIAHAMIMFMLGKRITQWEPSKR
jgi:cellulose synthase/poly-beta-1,6-N-acetylglucosamine synthase-like glycosyltransferase